MIVRTEAELNEMLQAIDRADVYCLDTETLNHSRIDIDLVGLSVAVDERTAWYVPTGHAGSPAQLPAELVLEKLKPIIERPGKTCVMHNAKYDMQVLKLVGGIEFPKTGFKVGYSPIWDTMIAAWLLDTENEIGLKALSKRILNEPMIELEDFAPKEKHPVTGDDIIRCDLTSIEDMAKYGMADVTQPLKLKKVFEKQIKEAGLEKVFYELEMPYVYVLAEMELNGIGIHKEKIDEFLENAPAQLKELEEKIYACRPSGQPFNIGSTKQLNEVLFKEMKIKPIGQKGKSGQYSTKEEYMATWAKTEEICRLILEHRQLDKLISTYLIGLSKRIDPDNRIRSTFNRFLATGRLSSSKPNLQNIPRPENDVFGLRSLFRAAPGKTLVVADYSQIELRLLAHFSRDPRLIEAFKKGHDIHSMTAKALFNLPEPVEEIKEKHDELRSQAKNFNFAMVYEAGIQRLAALTGSTQDEARALRDRYFRQFPGIEKYIRWSHYRAQRDGFVKTLIGRYRHLPDAKIVPTTKEENARKAAALRRATNSPIQGSAADIISIAMRNIWRKVHEMGEADRIKMVLQVHDELILEVDREIADEAGRMMEYEMENAVKLRVPLLAEYGIGDVWSEAKN